MSGQIVSLGKRWWDEERAPTSAKTLVIQKARRKASSQTKMLSVKRVADSMGCSIWKIYDRIKDKSLFAEWDGGQWRVPEYAIDDFYDFQRSMKKS